jgi:hypothetical protein
MRSFPGGKEAFTAATAARCSSSTYIAGFCDSHAVKAASKATAIVVLRNRFINISSRIGTAVDSPGFLSVQGQNVNGSEWKHPDYLAVLSVNRDMLSDVWRFNMGCSFDFHLLLSAGLEKFLEFLVELEKACLVRGCRLLAAVDAAKCDNAIAMLVGFLQVFNSQLVHVRLVKTQGP